MIISLVSLTYVFSARPSMKAISNMQFCVNETFCLLQACLLLVMQDARYDPEEKYDIGDIFNKFNYAWAIFNVGVMVIVTGKALCMSGKRCYNRRFASRKLKKKTPTKKPKQAVQNFEDVRVESFNNEEEMK